MQLTKHAGPVGGFRGLCLQPVRDGQIAVGTACGRVVLMDALSGEVSEALLLAPAVSCSVSSLRDLRESSESLSRPRRQERVLGSSAVICIASVAGGGALLALQESGTVSVVQLYRRAVDGLAAVASTIAPSFDGTDACGVSASLLNPDQRRAVLAECHGDQQMCAVVRPGSNVLELHRTDHNEAGTEQEGVFGRRKAFWVNVLNLSLKAVDPRTNSNVNVAACHVVFSGRELRVWVVGVLEGGGTEQLLAGRVVMPQHASSAMHKDLPLRLPLTVCKAFQEPLSSLRFSGRFCVVVQSAAVHVWDLAAGEDSAVALRLTADSMSFGGAGGWDHSATALMVHDRRTFLYIYRNDSPMLLKVALEE